MRLCNSFHAPVDDRSAMSHPRGHGKAARGPTSGGVAEDLPLVKLKLTRTDQDSLQFSTLNAAPGYVTLEKLPKLTFKPELHRNA